MKKDERKKREREVFFLFLFLFFPRYSPSSGRPSDVIALFFFPPTQVEEIQTLLFAHASCGPPRCSLSLGAPCGPLQWTRSPLRWC
jgi:hypothetical protein